MGALVNVYKKTIIHRYDDNGTVKYFSASDFPNLQAKAVCFYSGQNKLKGYFYYYDNFNKESLTVFCHGLFGGHRSYMVEIETLCKAGYTVFAYDMTGCFESEGQSIIAVTQFLKDLDCAFNYLKDSNTLNKFKNIYAIGHSCGAFAVQNIACFHPYISKIISISGFVSISAFFDSSLKKLQKIAKPSLVNYEKKQNPLYASVNSSETINKSKAKYLIVHSKDDSTISFDSDIPILQKTVTNPNVEYIVCNNKKHNPNYTEDAVTYMNSILGSYNGQPDYYKTTDWNRMTAQDTTFWDKALAFLKS